MSSLRRNKGFMMLEVILSVIIIASALVFILRSYMASLRAVEVSGRIQKACLALEEKLFELDTKGELAEGEESGEFEETGYGWALSAQPIDDKKKINSVAVEALYSLKPPRKIKIYTYFRNGTT